MDNLPFLLHFVKSNCPNLYPIIIPNGVSKKHIMKKLADKKKIPKCTNQCDICSTTEGKMTPVLVCDYDINKRQLVIIGVKHVCSLCKFCMDMPKVMELMVCEDKENEEVDSFSRHFLLVNGHNPDNQALLEEIISSCYSLHIVLKSYLSSSVDYSSL